MTPLFIWAFSLSAPAQMVEPRLSPYRPLEVHPDSIISSHLIDRLTELPWVLKPESTLSVVRRDYRLDFEAGTIATRDYVGDDPVSRNRVLSYKAYTDSLWWSTLCRQQGTQLNHPYQFKPEERRRAAEGQGLLPQIVLPDVLPSRLGDFLGGATPTINFSGQENLSFSGDSKYYLNRARDETFRNSKFPQLQMEQELNVQIDGRVGEKLLISLAHDSKLEEQFKNKVKIQYQGEPDEIIQLIEAGDTDLSISGPQFIAGSFPHKGLFGAKMKSQIGPMELTMIASKERGSTDQGNFEGQAVADTMIDRDLEYDKRRYYFIERPDFLYKSFPDTVFAQRLPRLETVRLYLDNGNYRDDAQTGAISGIGFNYITVPDADSRGWGKEDLADLKQGEDYLWGNYDLLERGIDYILVEGGMIYLREQIQDGHTLAVSYSDGERTWGDASRDTLRLKMLKRAGQTVPLLQPEVRGLWDYEMKNIYSLGARDLNKQSVDVTIYRTSREGGGKDEEFYNQTTTYLQLLGMDKKGPGTPAPDGRIDPEWIDEERGLLFIPFLQPFIDPFAAVGDEESQNLRVYWDDNPKGDHSRYKIVISYKSVKSTYSLGRLNILDGSESVKVNGETLVRNRDYMIIYEIGQLTFMGDALDKVNDPNAKIEVNFEYAPFMAQTQKTLMGARANWIFNETSNLGGTFMFESKGVREIKPQLGREPSRTMVGDIDGAVRLQPRVLTDLVNRLPFIETDRPSDFNFSGEVAVSIPNPNTSENGSAYVDDMEGSRQSDNLSTIRLAWHQAGKPEQCDTPGSLLRWFNIKQGYQKKYIYPDLPEDEQEEAVNVLNIQYLPFGKAFPQANFAEIDSLDYYPAIMRSLSRDGTDYSEREFVEVLIRGDAGRVNLDLGDISEDCFQPGRSSIPDTEDKNFDGRLDNGEDTGLDGVAAADALLAMGDTGNDDYPEPQIAALQEVKSIELYLQRADGLNWNGLEGNKGEVPDTEDINGNGNLDTRNDYFEYSFNLMDEPEEYYLDGWKLYRLPLSRPSRTVGNPRSDRKRVKYVRLWFEDVPDSSFIQLGSLEVVGNRWIKKRELTATNAMPDSNFIVGVKNSKDHPQTYVVPRDILMNIDYRGRTGKEQSLMLKCNELPADSTGLAYQPLYNAQDYTVYQSISFLLYAYTETKPDTVEFILRLESDESNYYEYRQRMVFETVVTRDLWQQIRLYFADLTRLKGSDPDTTKWRLLEAESRDNYRVYQGRNLEDEHRRIVISGSPSLTKVWRITTGAYNPSREHTITGEVWLNELRLTDVRREVGTASRLQLITSFADVANLNFRVQAQDENFHSLGRDVGSGRNSQTYSLQTRFNANKFFPDDWGLAIPIQVSTGSNLARPKFSTGSDEILTETQSARQRTETKNRDISVSFGKQRKADDLLTRLLVDNFSARASYSNRGTIGPTAADSTTSTSGSVAYDANTTTPPKLSLYKDFGINLLPSSFRYSIGFDETKRTHYDINIRTQERKFKPLEPGRELRNDMSFRYEPMRSLRTNYSLTSRRDIRGHTNLNRFNLSGDLSKLKLGREVQRAQNASLDFNPTISRLIQPAFSYSANYNEDHSLTLPGVTDSSDARNVDATTRSQLRLSLRTSDFIRYVTGTSKADRQRSAIDRQKQILESRRRRQAGAAEEEKEAAPAEPAKTEKKEEEKKGEPFWALRAVGRVGDVIEPVQGTLSRDGRSRFNGVPDRPGMNYQLGFTAVGGDSIFKLREEVSDQVALNGGLTPLSSLKITGRYQWRRADREQNKNVSRESSLTWPDLNVNLSQLERFALFKPFVRTFSVLSGYQITETRQGDVNLGEYTERSHDKNVQWSPLVRLQINWRNRLVTHFSHSRSQQTRYQYIDNEVNNIRVDEKTAYTGTVSYSFNLPKGVNIFGRVIKFTSNLDLALDFDYQQSVGTHQPKGKNKDINQDKTNWTLTPKIAYNFSNALRGGLDLRLSTIRDKKSPLYDQRTVGLRVWSQFSFNTAQSGGVPGTY